MVVFANLPWQPCPDTSQSAGSHIVRCQDGLDDSASFVPDPVAVSSAEAKHHITAFGASAGCERTCQLDPDTPLTGPVLVDSQSIMAMASSDHDARRTRHVRCLPQFLWCDARPLQRSFPHKRSSKTGPSKESCCDVTLRNFQVKCAFSENLAEQENPANQGREC
jgi:hypothetical protein